MAKIRAGLKKGLSREIKTKRTAAVQEVINEVVSIQLKQVAMGERTLASAVGYDDKKLMGFYKVGENLIDASRYDEANTVFEGILALDDTIPLFLLGGALCSWCTHDLEVARNRYDRAVEMAHQIPGGADIAAGAEAERARFLQDQGVAA